MRMCKLPFLALLALGIAGCGREALPLKNSLIFVRQPPISISSLGTEFPPGFILAGGGIYSTFSSFVSEYPEVFQPLGSCLVRLDPDGSSTPLTPTEGAAVREPEVSFDGERVVFSMKTSLRGKWQVYEVHRDGRGLRKISQDEKFNDFDPAYLPDERIVFVSDRLGLLDPIFHVPSAQLYRMNADGSDVTLVGFDPGGEFNPVVTADGRLLFTEWNSHYKNFAPDEPPPVSGIFPALDRFLIWKTALDGTSNAQPFFGQHLIDDFTGGFLYVREMRGGKLLAALVDSRGTYGSGSLVLLDPSKNADEQSIQFLTPNVHLDLSSRVEARFREPYPLADGRIVAVRGSGPLLEAEPLPPPGPPGIREGFNGHERTSLLHPYPGPVPRFELVLLDPQEPDSPPRVLAAAQSSGAWSLSPVELAARPRPQMAQGRSNPAFAYGIMNSKDVYLRNRNASRVRNGDRQPLPQEGEVAKVQIFQGAYEPDPLRPDSGLKVVHERHLGDVPVFPDGSFAAVVPASVPLFWKLVREDGSSIVEEPYFHAVRPGEVISCKGCHLPHTAEEGRASNQALASPTNLTGGTVDQDQNGKVDLLEQLAAKGS